MNRRTEGKFYQVKSGDRIVSEDLGGPLRWEFDRWHCYNPRRREWMPIHAGHGLELKLSDGSWVPVRIESQFSGRILTAYYDALAAGEGKDSAELDVLRWPLERWEAREQPAKEVECTWGEMIDADTYAPCDCPKHRGAG
jgi:hypothetical protein